MNFFKSQSGSILGVLVFAFGIASLMAITATLMVSWYYAQEPKSELLMHSSFSAYESCLGLFNNTISQANQISGCIYGQCLDVANGSGCLACGSANAKLAVGDCYCQLKYFSNTLVTADFEVAGICANGRTQFTNQVTLPYCTPDCAGKCGGLDGCGGICPNTCPATDPICGSDDITCCGGINPMCP